MIYTKRKKGEEGGVFPLFRGELRGGFEIVVTTFLQWNWDSSELGYFHETKTARLLRQKTFRQHISSRSRDFEKGIWLVVCKENRVSVWDRAEQDPEEWSWEWSRCGLLGRDAIIWCFNRIKLCMGGGDIIIFDGIRQIWSRNPHQSFWRWHV